ncbi:MAG: enoyl-CoA hydratase/isomerase family protein [Gemmatimonadaceae bacterium]|nr:enoyl-CoA hydratase/isomerase family protein [Gemmatimonadaceae bacterium]
MDMTLLQVAIEDGVATLTLDDPGTGNALSVPMVQALSATLRDLGGRDDLAALVLTGRGASFCSGAPRDLLLALAAQRHEPGDIRLAEDVLAFPVPVIAAMQGHGVGGGFALGLCADVVCLAADARYGLPFLSMGFTPGMGSTRLLEHVLSPALAHELLYTGELRRGSALRGTGGINHVLPSHEVLPRALDVARRIAAHAPDALRLLKRAIGLRRRIAFQESHLAESLMHRVTFADTGIRARIESGYAG